jgi:phosphoglycerate dehydrogenase-like enzyme
VSSTAELAPVSCSPSSAFCRDVAVRDGRFQLARMRDRCRWQNPRLIGLGRIGARMASYGRALGMKVLAWSQNLTTQAAAAAGAVRTEKDELFSLADVVSLHLVLSERSRGIVGATDLARMKQGAILVNTARAPLVDENALIAAVQSGRIIAALDVFYREPLSPDHPLARAPNVVLTPHFGYSVIEVYREYYQHSVENALAYLDGKPIRVLQSVEH